MGDTIYATARRRKKEKKNKNIENIPEAWEQSAERKTTHH